MVELRSVVAGLRPADLESDGLVAALRRHLSLLERAHGLDIVVLVEGEPDLEPEQEAPHLPGGAGGRHQCPSSRLGTKGEVSISATPGGLIAEVSDDGVGFDLDATAIRSRRLGLTSMGERAGWGGRCRGFGPGEGDTGAARGESWLNDPSLS